MSEKIKLKVPSKPAAEYVEHGNFKTELTPGGVITVENRRFAEWLVREYACAEVDAEAVEAEPAETETEPKKTAGGKK